MFSCRNKETHVHSLAQMVQLSWQVKTTRFGHPTSLGDIPNMEKDTAPLQNSKMHKMTWEAWYDFWSILGNFRYHHHVQQGVKFYAPTESSFPIPLKNLMPSSGPKRHWMFCKKVRLMTSGASMVTASYLGRGPFSRSSENCMEPFKVKHVDQVEINKHSGNIQVRIHMARTLVECVENFAAKKKNRIGRQRSRSSKHLEI